MKPHRLDFFALFAGLLFAALGVGFLLDALEVWDADVSWAPPIVLIALGVGGLLTTMVRRDDKPGREPEAQGEGELEPEVAREFGAEVES